MTYPHGVALGTVHVPEKEIPEFDRVDPGK